jgi:putative tryptophan/tyrosine transport system substrate-binding protein
MRHRTTSLGTTRFLVFTAVLGLLFASCGGTPEKKYTIGVVNYQQVLDPVLDGFKVRMAELGYVEGRNIAYVYHGAVAPEPKVLEGEVRGLLAQKVDLLLTMGTLPTRMAKQAVEGTNVPVVFGPVINPVDEGLVESITRPGGNVTGVQNGTTIPKALEWLLKLAPRARKVYVIYHPRDAVSQTAMRTFPEIAASLGFELVTRPVQSREEAFAIVAKLPRDAAIFAVPAPSLDPVSGLFAAAIERRIPVAANIAGYAGKGALLTYGPSLLAMGKQAGRLADQIFKGAKPAELPVETSEYFLEINLGTAKLIGLDIEDTTLRQANNIVR